MRGLALVLGFATALVVGCSPARPPNSVALSFYMRNGSGEPYYFEISGSLLEPIDGPVQEEPSSTGCGFVGNDWQLIVTQGDDRPDPAAEIVGQTDGATLGNPDPVAISLSIEPDGSVVIGEGIAAWWDGPIQRCP
jgi:hypothetical protein